MTVRNAGGIVGAGITLVLLVACSSSSSSTPSGDAGLLTTAPPGADGGIAVADGGDTCQPNDLTAFAYTAPGASNPLFANLCTPAQVDTFLSQCLLTGTTAAGCLAWQSAPSTGACGGCLLAARNAAKTGAFFATADGTVTDWNLEGCLDHFKLGCGPSYVEYSGCEDFACDSTAGDATTPAGNCGAATNTALTSCLQSAEQGGCSARAGAAVSGCAGVIAFGSQAATTPFPGEICFAATGEPDTAYFRRFALLFCGTAAESDAGTDDAGNTTVDAGPVDAATGG